MSDSGLETTRIRTFEQAQHEIAVRDRRGWYAFTPSGQNTVHYVMRHGGKAVALCSNQEDAEFIVRQAKAWAGPDKVVNINEEMSAPGAIR